MLTRLTGFLDLLDDAAEIPTASRGLERDGFALVSGAFDATEVAELRVAIGRVFDDHDADVRNPTRPAAEIEEFRYEVLNRSEAVQRLVADRRILDVVEPLLAEDCHVIANTAWRNEPRVLREDERRWHTDAGPHIPRPPWVDWDDRIPYPVFAVAVHVMLEDCPVASGPTEVIPGSHRSGQPIPPDRRTDDDLEWNGQTGRLLPAQAGDLVFFTSDAWHRRHPPAPDDGDRFFLQAHYGRRDLAQRLRGTRDVNHLSSEAVERAVAGSARDRSVVGLHKRGFYDG